MRNLMFLVIILLALSCNKNESDLGHHSVVINTICNQEHIAPLDVLFSSGQKEKNFTLNHGLNYELRVVNGSEIVESIDIDDDSNLAVLTGQLGIAGYKIIRSESGEHYQVNNDTLDLVIISHFLLDFTQREPFEPRGSIKGISYPDNSLVEVTKDVVGMDADNKIVNISPALLVANRVAPFPHNDTKVFPDFEPAIKYYGYKENDGDFKFRFEPIIPLLEVGDGNNNRGAGIIVINKNMIINNPDISYELEAYCTIRTRTDDKETYNLGLVVGTVNKSIVRFKDAIVARDYFNIGYSSSGQIYSEEFNLENDDYLCISIVGEAGKGRDKNRTTRFEYIKISPIH